MQIQSNPLELPVATKDPALVDAFLRVQPHAHIDSARKGKILVQEDGFADHSMLLLDGWIAFSKMLPDGETQIIDVMLPGDFALIGAINAPVSTCSVEALSDVRFINVRAMHANGPAPEMATLRELLGASIVITQARTAELLLRMGKGSAASRIAYALLEFYVRLEAIGMAEGATFSLPMTQHQIGEFTGLSNVHVCRTMRRFERAGIIAHPGKSDVLLNDLDALCEVAGIDLSTFRRAILIKQFQ